MDTTISIAAADGPNVGRRRDRIRVKHGEFSIEDQNSQYLGNNINKIIE
jgi:hypothetical protein